MDTEATVSSRYNVNIPPSIRERLGIKPGQKVSFIEYHGSVHLVPVTSMEEARGSLKGRIKDTSIIRDADRIL